ncbi:MAG: response regulator [Lachnospiraceae bacterium]|nr:response regulator [Lachnospiraceae bacterium]
MKNIINRKIKLSHIIFVLTTIMLVGIVVLNIALMYNIASEQTEEIGRMRIQNIAIGFEKSLARAESTFDRVSSDFEELLLGDASEEEIRTFLSKQREMEYELSEGHCLNVFCAVDGVVMISDMDTPEDYVLQERSWYRALMTKKKGEVYISPAYDDAFTDNMCFTMARMLSDGTSVVGIDYSVSEIQLYVSQMSGDGNGDAIIIDENETIVGYTDANMIGKSLSAELPQYRDAFLRAVAADTDNFVLHSGMGLQSDSIFCSRTDNGWYMMCSVSNWNLYHESYFRYLRNSMVSVFFIIVIIVLYFIGQRNTRKDDDGDIQIQKKKIKLTEKEQRRYQINITLILVLTMILVIVYTVNTTINSSISNMEKELQDYSDKVEEWVLEQKSILDMFDSVVVENPELLNDYDETMKYLDDIARYFPDMGLVFIANPDFSHGHFIVANNGWVPAADYVLEERPWYVGAMTSREFYITEPFYDLRTGEYCITFSKVIESDKGEFYGVFGIHFYVDMLRDIIDQSHDESEYAFMVDKNGLMMGHPNPEYRLEYRLSHEAAVNIHDLAYDRLYSQSGLVTLLDYDGEYKVCLAMDEDVSGFRIIMVRDWDEVYGGAIRYAILFLVFLGGCILVVNWVISRMIYWQRNANEELKKAADAAIQGEQAKSQFLSNMSHEIRTPINAILGMNEMILREYTDSQLLTYAGNIQNSGRTLLTLINDILDMSKIESGKMEIIPTEYKLADLLLDLWNVIYLKAKDKNLTLSFTLDETMPGTLYGDDVRVKQIIVNLLTNAVKYTPKGSVKLNASYENQVEDMITLIVSVQDTGIGIKEEDMGKLFENFQRLDEDKNRHIEGTGLGMSITTMLLKMMDGDISVESVYQEGSTFTVRIPQKVVNNEPVGDFESIRNSQPQTSVKHYDTFEAPEANIMVVDDNHMNLVVFTSFLKRTKMNIVTAESGRKCLELVKEQPFHIIFMDHMMPEMDGVETFHEIRKLKGSPNENTPVIALTANAVAGAREYFIEEGFTDFLSKPVDSIKLEQMIVTYLPEELVHEKDSEISENQAEDIVEENSNENGEAEESASGNYSRYQEYGINIENGIFNLAGNLNLYLDILDMFTDDKDKQSQLKQFITDKNPQDYGTLVHALKGEAYMLGAQTLGDMAYEHEKQSKAGNLAYVEEHWDELVECWDRVLSGFDEFYKENGRTRETVAVQAIPVTDGEGRTFEVTPEEIAEVILWLDDFETIKAEEKMKEWLQNPLKPEQQTLIKNALTAAEKEYDYEKAIEILENMSSDQ